MTRKSFGRKIRVFLILLFVCLLALLFLYLKSLHKNVTTEKSDDFSACVNEFVQDTAEGFTDNPPDIIYMGKSIKNYNYRVSVDSDLYVYASENFLEEIIGCSVNRYLNGDVSVDRRDVNLRFKKDSSEAYLNGEIVELEKCLYVTKNGDYMIPLTQFVNELDFDITYNFTENRLYIEKLNEKSPLPEKYDLRTVGRVTEVRDQGRYGTCWAFASLGALETTLLPAERNAYSVDHMSMNNSYNLDINMGGEHIMSIAYLAAWQGPVYDRDDPYGDGVSNSTLTAVKHLEEAIVINERDDEVIKGAIYRYGGIETSLYLQMAYVGEGSDYYNDETFSYYCDTQMAANHDIVIVGWDDNYPKENFPITPERNGAFICRNSWGSEFAEDGYFYVSYEDKNICRQSIVFTVLADRHNFDKIYQSDLMGWVGQVGFGRSNAFFANAYTAGKCEALAGASFYATGDNTQFSVYVVRDFDGVDAFSRRELITSGAVKYAGYYTVKFDDKIELSDGEKFAVVVEIDTPGSTRPIAVEFAADERTENAVITDGEGYISLHGDTWVNAERNQECNVCLKAFTVYNEE